MPEPSVVTRHYSHGSLLETIESGLTEIGKSTTNVGVDDLAPVDEFHIGGRLATEHFLDQLALNASDRVLDIGCGLGGSSRFAASRYGCTLHGVDLTPEYVETGQILCNWVGLNNSVTLNIGDATQMQFEDARFDKAFMLHVGMNIADKAALFKEIKRVLKPGATLGVYDIMRVDSGALVFPVPWATNDGGSAVCTVDEYKTALSGAGFIIESDLSRRDFALGFFEKMKEKAAEAGGPPAMGLHLLMGSDTQAKIGNMVRNIADDRIAPVEMIMRLPT